MARVRFVFGKEMTEDQMDDAILKMAKECGIPINDNRKKKAKDSKKIGKRVKNEDWSKKSRKRKNLSLSYEIGQF